MRSRDRLKFFPCDSYSVGVPEFTDPLSAKELVDKTYYYMDRVTKECRKTLNQTIVVNKKTVGKSSLCAYLGGEVEKWFSERDRQLNVRFDPSAAKTGPRGDVHITLNGKTKDAKFSISCDAEIVVNSRDPSMVFVKSLNVYADRARFQRP